MLPRSSVREMKGKSQGPFLPSLKTNPPSPWTLIKTASLLMLRGADNVRLLDYSLPPAH